MSSQFEGNAAGGQSSRFNWSALLLGIIAVFASVIAFSDPGANLLAVTFILGVAVLFRGIVQIWSKWALKTIPGLNTTLLLVVGILNVIFGVLLLGNLWVGVMLLPMLFAIWFTLESIFGLANTGFAKRIGAGYYWFRIILCLLGIVIGVSLFMHPLSAAMTLSFLVGFYFMLLAITCFVEAFGARRA